MNLENLKIWSVTDGSQGMRSQTNGLSREISQKIIEIKTELIFPWNKLQPGILPIFSWIFKNKIDKKNIPDMIISCGRKSVYLSLYLKKKYKKIINVHIQNPKISYNNFNFVITPKHDGVFGKNVINSIGALHQFDLKNLKNLKNNFNIKKNKLVTCIIGGENQHYYFRESEIQNLCNNLIELKKNMPEINLLIITSRRTSDKIKKNLKLNLSNYSIIWTGEGDNPYSFAIKFSEYFVITSDSTSMISESSITGKPIYIYHLPFKRISKRIERFHFEFEKLNITRNFSKIIKLEQWSYNPLQETKRIARILKKRIIEEFK